MRIRRSASLALAILFAACFATSSCGGTTQPADAATDVPSDAGPTVCPLQGLSFLHSSIGVVPGTSRHTYLDADADAPTDMTITLTASMPGIITLPATLTITAAHSRATLNVTGVAAGTVMVHATTMGFDTNCTADIEVAVTAPTLPACAGMATGMVTPGGTPVGVTTGTLMSSSVAVAAGASRTDIYHVDPFMVSIGCHADQVPTGYTALGPAVTFTSDSAYRFRRELDFVVPIALSLLPSQAHRGHVEMAYAGPGVTTPRIVGIATPVFTGSAGYGLLHFQAPRLGTYQPVVRSDAPHMVSRTFHGRGIMGFSMGGSGSGRIGTGHPELFDFVAPLGGPTDWIYLLEYIHRYHIGGFCTEAQRQAGMPCSAASLDYAPDRGQLYEHTQEFEDWWYEDGYGGQGGHFNRSDYISIFRDLTAMFANANTDTSSDPMFPDITPPGIPDSVRTMSDADRCMMANLTPLTIHGEPTGGDTNPMTGFFDDEYNPQGHYDVIPFCDGAERLNFDPATFGPCTASTPAGTCLTDTGAWDPMGTQNVPMEVALAVDINHNGVRDPGEPVIRDGHEPFTDSGCDGLASSAEAGFDAITNPDPAGDDYDFQYNPTGTEGNWERDDCGAMGSEHFDDFGLDGVNNTPQVPMGFDHGEGNGHYDIAAGAERMISTSPRGLVRGYRGNGDMVHQGYSEAVLDGFDFYADGGVRDLFNWAVQGHHTLGGFAARDLPVRFYNGHGALHLDGRPDSGFAFNRVLYEEIGRHTLIRYGSIDATQADLINGDGGHVGTPAQLLNRFFSAVGMMSERWPDGDRTLAHDRICSAMGSGCDHINSMVQMFTAPTTGRTGQVTIVLPPGYFAPENANLHYPVVYFLHGYGMDPASLQAIGNLMWNYMITMSIPEARRVPKMIFVFPDGRCLPSECLRGTFYTDAPASTPHGAQMEQFLLDLDVYMHNTYRVRADQTVMVSE